MASLGRILATIGFLSYGLVLLLEWWRPGFVTYFWNPEILLILALLGVFLSCRGSDSKPRMLRTVIFLLFSVMILVPIIWYSLPSLGSRIIMGGATFLLIVSLVTYFHLRVVK